AVTIRIFALRSAGRLSVNCPPASTFAVATTLTAPSTTAEIFTETAALTVAEPARPNSILPFPFAVTWPFTSAALLELRLLFPELESSLEEHPIARDEPRINATKPNFADIFLMGGLLV